jgi:hypothetical protein
LSPRRSRRWRCEIAKRFTKWLDENDIKMSQQDRAALLQLGQNVKAMRVILEPTNTTSFRMIWHNVQKQIASSQHCEDA